MAEAFSGWVVEWHGGKTRAYVTGWVESETDKTATIYVWGCCNAWQIAQYGVRVAAYIDGSQVGTTAANIFSSSGTSDVGAVAGRLTVDKGSSGRYITIQCSIWGETVNGYGPIGGSATASASVWIGAKALRPPSAPSGLSASRNANANIDLKWTNNASNATWTSIERREKGGSWELIYEKEVVVSSHADSPGIGTFKYRVRYWNPDGYSGYSNESDYIATLCAPAAPTILSPASGATIDANAGTALLKWQHNAIDSSDQTEAVLSWSTDNAEFQSVALASEKQYRLPIEQNRTYYWKAATRGAHEDFGPESGVAHFLVRTAPVALLQVDTPARTLPIPVSWSYEDAMGTQASARLSIADQSGAVLFAKDLETEHAYTVEAAEFTPEQGKTYAVHLSVTSTTSLSYHTQAAITVDYLPPAKPKLAIATDPARASNTVTVFAGRGEEDTPPTATISLFRDGELAAKDLYPGSAFVDPIPPLDRQVEYRAVAYAMSGSAAEKTETVLVPSGGFAFFNFDGQVAKVGMNLSLKDETKNEKEAYTVASSKYQKVFYGEHSERTGSIDADVFWAHDALGYGEEAMLESIERLKEHSGLVHLRLPYSDAFAADVDVSTGKSADAYNVASVSIEWRRAE